MKQSKSIFFIGLFILCTLFSHAQEEVKYKIGGQFFLGMSVINGDYAKNFNRKPYLARGIGAIAERHISEQQFFNLELNISGQGDSTFQTWKSIQDTLLVTDSLTLGQRLVYFQVPMLFGYKFQSKKRENWYGYIKGGPYIGILWSALENRKYSITTPNQFTSSFDHGYRTNAYSSLDFGFQIAIGLFGNDASNLEIRFCEGISDITRSNGQAPYYNRMVTLNYRYYLYQD